MKSEYCSGISSQTDSLTKATFIGIHLELTYIAGKIERLSAYNLILSNTIIHELLSNC